ncbi:MAG: hypothetical protein PHC51_04985 [bacterium]|nr:hypothetical protein [bacterium]
MDITTKAENRKLFCWHCQTELAPTLPVSRRDTCHSCGRDIRVCKNCLHYDASRYNECREPVAERVKDKETANFCDFFSPGGHLSSGITSPSGASKEEGKSEKELALEKLNSLFGK